jgi:hypothetical protein
MMSFSMKKKQEHNGIFSTEYGRLVFDREIERGSVVFCQGSQGLKSTVSKACRHKKVRFFGGLGGEHL